MEVSGFRRRPPRSGGFPCRRFPQPTRIRRILLPPFPPTNPSSADSRAAVPVDQPGGWKPARERSEGRRGAQCVALAQFSGSSRTVSGSNSGSSRDVRTQARVRLGFVIGSFRFNLGFEWKKTYFFPRPSLSFSAIRLSRCASRLTRRMSSIAHRVRSAQCAVRSA